MSNYIYFTFKYWRKHKKSLVALLFSGVLLCAVLTCVLLMHRQNFSRWLDKFYDKNGFYSMLVSSEKTELIDRVTDENTLRGEMYTYGTAGIGEVQYQYGYIDDPHDLAHIPFESGRMPKTYDEVAIVRNVLTKLGFYGKIGDNIELDIGTFKLVGIIDENYGNYRTGTLTNQQFIDGNTISPFASEDVPVKTQFTPTIFVTKREDLKPEYTYVMLDKLKGITEPPSDYKPDIWDHYDDGMKEIAEEFDMYVPLYAFDGSRSDQTAYYANKAEQAHIGYNQDALAYRYFSENYAYEAYKMSFLYIIAAVIATLSVIVVMRNIFSERENTLSLMHRIGLSKRKLRAMLAIEYICFAVLQAVIGIAIGSAAHLGIASFQANVLDMKDISGFTKIEYSYLICPSPILWGTMVSALVLLVGYVFAALMLRLKAKNRKKKKARSLFRCISRIFRNRAVTIIQTVALTLICFGTIFGYFLFNNTVGWYSEDGEYSSNVNTYFGDRDQFDFDEDNISEYYFAPPPTLMGTDSFLFMKQTDQLNGIKDDVADTLENTYAKGTLNHTFILDDASADLMGIIGFSDEDRKFLYEQSSEQGKKLLDTDKKMFSTLIALTNKETIEQLKPYVTSGEIDIDKINSGEQMILVMKDGKEPLETGAGITVGSLDTVNGFGIENAPLSDTKIGAVVRLTGDTNQLLTYSVSETKRYNLLTTVTGAQNLELSGASYTALMARDPIGDKLPMGTNYEVKSLEQARRELFIQNATMFGSLGLLVLIMSLLGFAAYFNGIDMKIRMKEYQISVMRAIGTPLKKLRRRLMLDSIRIPVIASAIAYTLIRIMQSVMQYVAHKAEEIRTCGFNMKYTEGLPGIDPVTGEEGQRLMDYARELNNTFMTGLRMWFMNALIPTLIIFAVMCIVTIILTRRSVGKFDSNIALSISKGRKRR